jgi:hypothetical protein
MVQQSVFWIDAMPKLPILSRTKVDLLLVALRYKVSGISCQIGKRCWMTKRTVQAKTRNYTTKPADREHHGFAPSPTSLTNQRR